MKWELFYPLHEEVSNTFSKLKLLIGDSTITPEGSSSTACTTSEMRCGPYTRIQTEFHLIKKYKISYIIGDLVIFGIISTGEKSNVTSIRFDVPLFEDMKKYVAEIAEKADYSI